MTAESFKPQFTTSVSANQKRKEEREGTGVYFGDRVKTVTTQASKPSQKPLTRPLKPQESSAFEPALRPLTARQKALLHAANSKDARNRRGLP